jgi:hypothetical protein
MLPSSIFAMPTLKKTHGSPTLNFFIIETWDFGI